MNIRTRLTLLFISIVAVILLAASTFIYLFSADYREEAFYDRLQSKANNTATLLIDVDEIDVDLLKKIERSNPVSVPNERIVIFDYQDEILFTTDSTHQIHIDKALLDRARLEEDVRFRQEEFEVLGFLFKGQFDRFVVITAGTDIYGFNKLKNLRQILLSVFAISILIASISGWLFAGRVLRPMSKVIRQVDEITASSLNKRVDDGNGQDEIARLAQTFNRMLGRLEDAFVVQRSFITNASHELRTPLTAITGQLEVSLLINQTVEDHRKTIASVLDDIKQLTSLANQLLLLAQTSAEGFQMKATAQRLDELVWECRDTLLRHHPSYKVVIGMDPNLDDESMFTIEGDKKLLSTAFSNVLENGCKYSNNNTVHVWFANSADGLNITFRDEGIGIAAEDLPNIFEPFYRGKNVQGLNGHGIGLSIVRRIVLLHNGTITTQSTREVGTQLTIGFRRPPRNHHAWRLTRA